ncbi:MAG TPA: P-type conjugative transfer protein TrbG [Hyphomonas sp.]|uniref:P-type conjugative transfer protein TrbG n=1 Tax=Hyphomonas sp. UBA3195 TaxID=1946622 RepID=UPI000C656520|nr:P-type conjugative transfer protein TrbG [Hyphomonas sp. UBA3195]MAN91503.1 P-type conjugative transfer protein TrbG [Hyphomonadaceae bacterium]MBO6689479.1 P-type conjugative transfer protein TrbG [Henriciella sp.]HAQ75935.1 P-type conjugative transfer protein TrbG [Hyphomonas sp.]|tara:strand:+ start:52713 stop:53741 length:1029 start_codon:yes stop_codon:yes gene_type:complete
MKRFALILLASSALAACESFPAAVGPDITLDEPDYVEDLYLAPDAEEIHLTDADLSSTPVVYRTYTPTIVSGTVPDQLKPMPTKTETQSLKPYQAIETANGKAAVEPSLDNYMNAIQVYPYTVGALYQVYCAPEQVTDIVLQPGEELVSVSAGDTVRWVLGDTISGTGDGAQAHILIKPTQAGLKTNLIITTSLRAYHLELRAFEETYMAAVSWRYADQQLVTRVARSGAAGASASPSSAGLQLERLKFRYDLDGDFPHWRPDRVFDDGRKVYIQFPARLDQGEAPALFVIGRDGKAQLVNYRMSGDYYVVDRLFARAELRLGEKRQDVVKIARNDLGGARP